MRLSIKQKAALVRMLDPWWKTPRGNGTVQHGFGQTLYSLQRKDLVRFVAYNEEHDGMQGPFWILTEEGREIAKTEEQKDDPKVRREVRR